MLLFELTFGVIRESSTKTKSAIGDRTMPASYLKLAHALVHDLTIAHDWQKQDMITEENSDMFNNRHLMLLHLQLNMLYYEIKITANYTNMAQAKQDTRVKSRCVLWYITKALCVSMWLTQSPGCSLCFAPFIPLDSSPSTCRSQKWSLQLSHCWFVPLYSLALLLCLLLLLCP